MKDSRTGAVGVVGLVLLLLLKWQAIATLPLAVRWQGLLLAPLLGRFAMVTVAALARRARTDGLGAACIAGAGWPQLILALLLSAIASLALLGRTGAVALAAALVIGYGIRTYFHHRLGGITGDIIGCAGELSETAAFVIIATLGTSL